VECASGLFPKYMGSSDGDTKINCIFKNFEGEWFTGGSTTSTALSGLNMQVGYIQTLDMTLETVSVTTLENGGTPI